MRRFQIRIGFVALALAIGLTMAAYAADDKKDEVSLTQLPEAVQKTVNDQIAGGKIDKIEKETKCGKLQYEVRFTKADKKMEINIAPDGKVLATEEEITLAQTPAAVQKTIQDCTRYSVVQKVVRAMEDGKEHFGVVIVYKDRKQWLEIAPDGTVLPRETGKAKKEQ
jgi:hypothetical protein